ncbi:DJ-1/PfpI family protein [Deinococcus yavapaiensis]|uniref:Transcriptional regulator GlxA family with amidase domain n=1 Tax=Deinococcus yavapaiensis KR-236 TaxID=694435 RepID=A0A318S6I3_9DEIO|nr:DJ-1/PfpI family protein [Deinococcus yavapaiensis]PYE53823.1 transcriptional regulator GlxA family with amidase domain [Deinococcus yavapaiensis KR-236]
MPSLLRVGLSLTAFLVAPALVGVVNLSRATTEQRAPSPLRTSEARPPAPTLDPAKPTVAVVLGADVSEVADVLAPYAVFAASGRFNVVTVAPDATPVVLTGGLDLLPHFSLAALDRAVPGGPAVIVIPNIPTIRAEQNRSLLSWLRARGKTDTSLLLSICTGADALAETGLLDGRQATAHWGDLGWLSKKHPRVKWVRGERYVDEGRIVSSAGLLSGIDASLHVLARLTSREEAMRTARALNYPGARFLDDPRMTPYRLAPSDAITLLNAAFLWDRPTYGVALRDGMDELTLAALFDTYAASSAARLATTAPSASGVTSRYGLRLLPRFDSARSHFPALTLEGLGFPFDRALTDLAARQDVPTARFAARRLEYRFGPTDLRGRGWSGKAVYRPLLLGVLAALGVWALDPLVRRRGNRRVRSPNQRARVS